MSAWRDRVWTSARSRRCAGSAPRQGQPDPAGVQGPGPRTILRASLDQKRARRHPKMLPNDPATRNDILAKIRRVVSAVGKPEGVRAKRLAEVERLFGATVDA